jgi:Transposase C of IS166 homeodomain
MGSGFIAGSFVLWAFSMTGSSKCPTTNRFSTTLLRHIALEVVLEKSVDRSSNREASTKSRNDRHFVRIHFRIIALREAQLDQLKRAAADQIEAMAQRHKAELDAVLRRFYGPHAERFDPTQLLVFGITIDQLPVDHKTVEAEWASDSSGTMRRTNHHKHGRGKLQDHLPRASIRRFSQRDPVLRLCSRPGLLRNHHPRLRNHHHQPRLGRS